MAVLSVRLPEANGNTTALAAFRARADLAELASDASGTDALRFELVEERLAAGGGAPAFRAWVVSRQPPPEDASRLLPDWLAADLVLTSTEQLRTVWPERSRWRAGAAPQLEAGSLGEVGRLSLLVQQTTHRVAAEHADAFRHGWTDLGYNALGEDGVVRCDLLLQSAGGSPTFVARKVFKSAAALAAHERSAHYARWHQASRAMLLASGGGAARDEAVLLDTLFPRTAAFPFRSRWSTA